MAIISAWAVGSRSCSRWLWAEAITCSACTITAPTGTSPSAKAASASWYASRMYASCTAPTLVNFVLRVVPAKHQPAQPQQYDQVDELRPNQPRLQGPGL